MTAQDLHFNIFNKQGRIRREVQGDCTKVQARFRIMKSEYEAISEDYIQYRIAASITEELIKQKLYNITKCKISGDPLDNTFEYRAEINISPPEIKMERFRKDIFLVNDKEFTEQQIIKAIENTYPEELI